MKNSVLFFAISICWGVSFSQVTIKVSGIDSGGVAVNRGSYKLVYTIGEVAVQEISEGTVHLSEGFLGGTQIETLGVQEAYKDLEVQIYPNPVIDYVNFKFKDSRRRTLSIMDINGKVIKHFESDVSLFEMNLIGYVSGTYFVALKDDKQHQFKVFKVIKK